MSARGGSNGKRNNENLLAFEGFYQAGLVVIVDLDSLDPVGQLALASAPGDSRDGVLAGPQQGVGNGETDLAAGLGGLLVLPSLAPVWQAVLTPIMATCSMRLTKPLGWLFAYSGAIM